MNLVGWFDDIAASYQADTAMPPLAPLDPIEIFEKELTKQKLGNHEHRE
jgi:hypothetical protein